jgi:hypothetical protein
MFKSQFYFGCSCSRRACYCNNQMFFRHKYFLRMKSMVLLQYCIVSNMATTRQNQTWFRH